jgi:tellurite resistance protein
LATDDLERLTIAFGVDVLKRVAEADGHLDARELTALEGVYTEGKLRDLGFVDEFGLTKTWVAAAERARKELPGRLPEAQKLLLLGFFHTVCMADGDLHPEEVREVHAAAAALGISVERLGSHLDAMSGVQGDAPPVRK